MRFTAERDVPPAIPLKKPQSGEIGDPGRCSSKPVRRFAFLACPLRSSGSAPKREPACPTDFLASTPGRSRSCPGAADPVGRSPEGRFIEPRAWVHYAALAAEEPGVLLPRLYQERYLRELLRRPEVSRLFAGQWLGNGGRPHRGRSRGTAARDSRSSNPRFLKPSTSAV